MRTLTYWVVPKKYEAILVSFVFDPYLILSYQRQHLKPKPHLLCSLLGLLLEERLLRESIYLIILSYFRSCLDRDKQIELVLSGSTFVTLNIAGTVSDRMLCQVFVSFPGTCFFLMNKLQLLGLRRSHKRLFFFFMTLIILTSRHCYRDLSRGIFFFGPC